MKRHDGRSKQIATEALRLCGTDFRLHGRDEEQGLDCIGLAERCLLGAGISRTAPNGYSIRGGSVRLVSRFMALAGFSELSPDAELIEGDIVLVRPSPVQLHFMIRAHGGFVHAHAGLRKVVLSPGDSPWPILSIFRILES